MHAAAALAGVASLLLDQRRFPHHPVSDGDTAWSLTALVWVAAYLALLAGRPRTAGWLGVAGLATTAATADLTTGGVTSAYHLLATAVPVLALAAYHRDAPPVPARPWLIALPAGVAVLVLVAFATQAPGAVVVDWPGILCAALFAACAAHLATGGRGPWSGTLAVLALVVLGERVLTLVDYAHTTAPGPWLDHTITAGAVEAAALALAAAVVATRARRRPHRWPRPTAG